MKHGCKSYYFCLKIVETHPSCSACGWRRRRVCVWAACRWTARRWGSSGFQSWRSWPLCGRCTVTRLRRCAARFVWETAGREMTDVRAVCACLSKWHCWLKCLRVPHRVSLWRLSRVVHDNQFLQVVLDGAFVRPSWRTQVPQWCSEPRLSKHVLRVRIHLPRDTRHEHQKHKG